MKAFFLILISFYSWALFAQEFQFRENLTTEEKEYIDFLRQSWGDSNKTAPEAFIPIKKIILDDEYTKEIFLKAEAKLNQIGIQNLESIIEYCEDRKDGASGGFNQDVQILDYQFVAPGMNAKWSEETLKKEKNAFSSKILKTDFFEFLFTADRPSICANSDEDIRSAAGIFVHELIHFLYMDLYQNNFILVTMSNLQEYIDYNLNTEGGEFHAYQLGAKSEVRLLSKIGIITPNLQYDFINIEAEIIDEEGMREYVKKLYLPYYEQYRPTYNAYSDQIRSSMIYYLKEAITRNADLNSSWLNQAQKELERLKAIKL